MLLTRIWAVILTVLAVGCLAGMFLLSASSGNDFSEADKAAIRAVTEAGVAGLQAEIQGSPVQQVTGVLADPRLRAAVNRDPEANEDELPPEELPLPQILAEVAEDLRVRTSSNITLAVVEKTGAIVSVNGIAEPNIGELVASDPYKGVPPTEEGLFSITLGSEIYVVKVTKATESGRRLTAVDTLNIGAGSLLRRVLGSQTPAGLVRKGTLVGDIIGDQPVSNEIETLAREHGDEVSEEGASRVFTVGSGLDARIGALGRVPGPAGSGRSGAMLAVLSRRTAASGQRDLAEALGDARDKGLLGPANWALLIGLLLVSGGLAIYLPQLEAVGPMRRLSREFQAVSQGGQHQIFHDRYSGAPGEVARSAATAVEALRQAFLAELEIDDDVGEEAAEGRPAGPRSTRQRRLTRAHQKLSEKRGTGAEPLPGRRKRRTGSRPQQAVAPAPSPAADPPHDPPETTERTPVLEPSETTEEVKPEVAAPTPAAAPPGHGLPTAPPPAASTPPPPASSSQTMPAPPRHPTPVASPPSLSAPPGPPPLARPPSTMPAPSKGGTRPPDPAPIPSPATTDRTPVSTHQPAPPPAEGDGKDAAYQEIYDEFIQVKAACGEPTESLTFERFAAKLRKNERDLRKKRPGIKDVQFTVYVKDGKAALKAKVVK